MLAVVTCTLLVSWNIQTIELEKKQLFSNKVELLLPKSFGIMPEEMLKLKYPGSNRPTLVYSDEDGTVNIAFNHTTSKAAQAQIETYKNVFVNTFKTTYPTAEWTGSGVKEINGRKVGFLELTTQAVDTKIYNYLFFTDLDGRLLICTFNCTVEKKPEWAEVAKKIVNSFTVK